MSAADSGTAASQSMSCSSASAACFELEKQFEETCPLFGLRPYPAPLSEDRLEELKVKDQIDHQDTVGRYLRSRVIDRRDNEVKIHYINWDSKWDTWCDYTKEPNRFRKEGEISSRPSSRYPHYIKGDRVILRPLRKKDRDIREHEFVGVIHRLDKTSGQVQVAFVTKQLVSHRHNDDFDDEPYPHFEHKTNLYWTHLDNVEEVLGLASECSNEVRHQQCVVLQRQLEKDAFFERQIRPIFKKFVRYKHRMLEANLMESSIAKSQASTSVSSATRRLMVQRNATAEEKTDERTLVISGLDEDDDDGDDDTEDATVACISFEDAQQFEIREPEEIAEDENDDADTVVMDDATLADDDTDSDSTSIHAVAGDITDGSVLLLGAEDTQEADEIKADGSNEVNGTVFDAETEEAEEERNGSGATVRAQELSSSSVESELERNLRIERMALKLMRREDRDKLDALLQLGYAAFRVPHSVDKGMIGSGSLHLFARSRRATRGGAADYCGRNAGGGALKVHSSDEDCWCARVPMPSIRTAEVDQNECCESVETTVEPTVDDSMTAAMNRSTSEMATLGFGSSLSSLSSASASLATGKGAVVLALRNRLVSASPFFKALLLQHLSEQRTREPVPLAMVTVDAFNALKRFAYGLPLQFTDAITAYDTLIAADYLNFDRSVCAYCRGAMRSLLFHKLNVGRIIQFARRVLMSRHSVSSDDDDMALDALCMLPPKRLVRDRRWNPLDFPLECLKYLLAFVLKEKARLFGVEYSGEGAGIPIHRAIDARIDEYLWILIASWAASHVALGDTQAHAARGSAASRRPATGSVVTPVYLMNLSTFKAKIEDSYIPHGYIPHSDCQSLSVWMHNVRPLLHLVDFTLMSNTFYERSVLPFGIHSKSQEASIYKEMLRLGNSHRSAAIAAGTWQNSTGTGSIRPAQHVHVHVHHPAVAGQPAAALRPAVAGVHAAAGVGAGAAARVAQLVALFQPWHPQQGAAAGGGPPMRRPPALPVGGRRQQHALGTVVVGGTHTNAHATVQAPARFQPLAAVRAAAGIRTRRGRGGVGVGAYARHRGHGHRTAAAARLAPTLVPPTTIITHASVGNDDGDDGMLEETEELALHCSVRQELECAYEESRFKLVPQIEVVLRTSNSSSMDASDFCLRTARTSSDSTLTTTGMEATSSGLMPADLTDMVEADEEIRTLYEQLMRTVRRKRSLSDMASSSLMPDSADNTQEDDNEDVDTAASSSPKRKRYKRS